MSHFYSTGVVHVAKRTPHTLELHDGVPRREVFLDFIYAPIVEDDGTVSGIFVDGHEITDHVDAEQHLLLLNNELKHRVKNTLAMLSAIANQTMRGDDSKAEVSVFHDRLDALARANDVLTSDTGTSSDLETLVKTALKPFMTLSNRFEIEGPLVTIGSKQAISLTMALHELATNSAKYGAFKLDTGIVSIRWGITASDSVREFSFEWHEDGGPAINLPNHHGFGSRLIERVLPLAFNGTVEVMYRTEGLFCRLKTSEENLNPPVPEPFILQVH